jgi:hypothetical protein
MADVAEKTEPNGRRTWFKPGNQLARGNPNAVRMFELRRTLLGAVDPGQLVTAFKKLEGMAVNGDLNAMRLYFEYSIGKPTQAVELSGPGGESIGGDRLRLVVMAALANFPEARQEVAAGLLALSREPSPPLAAEAQTPAPDLGPTGEVEGDGWPDG